MSNARNTRRKGSNPLAVLANADRMDRVKTGHVVAPREVKVTARVSIKREFTAPRIEMGDYTPVDTRAAIAASRIPGWTTR